MANRCVGALGYADDVTLLAPTTNALNCMLKECEQFAIDFNVTFNAVKTVGIKFGKTNDNAKVMINNNVIQWRDSVKHLDNMVNNSLNDTMDCHNKKIQVI